MLSYDCKIAELILIDPSKYKNLKIKLEINKFNDLSNKSSTKISPRLNKTPPSNINNYMDIRDLDEKNVIYCEIDNKYKNNYSSSNNIKLFNNTSNNYNEQTKRESKKGQLAKELENSVKVESNTHQNDIKSILLTNKTSLKYDEKNEKSLCSNRESSKNDYTSNKKVISSNKQSPERDKKLIEKIKDGYDKNNNNNLNERELLFSEGKSEDLSKSSLQNYNSKINQILNRNPSLDEKQFDIMKSSDLKLKIDSMRSEISDSLRKDKETSFNKKSTNNESFNNSMRNIGTKNKNNEKLKQQLQKQNLKNISLDINLTKEKI